MDSSVPSEKKKIENLKNEFHIFTNLYEHFPGQKKTFYNKTQCGYSVLVVALPLLLLLPHAINHRRTIRTASNILTTAGLPRIPSRKPDSDHYRKQ